MYNRRKSTYVSIFKPLEGPARERKTELMNRGFWHFNKAHNKFMLDRYKAKFVVPAEWRGEGSDVPPVQRVIAEKILPVDGLLAHIKQLYYLKQASDYFDRLEKMRVRNARAIYLTALHDLDLHAVALEKPTADDLHLKEELSKFIKDHNVTPAIRNIPDNIREIPRLAWCIFAFEYGIATINDFCEQPIGGPEKNQQINEGIHEWSMYNTLEKIVAEFLSPSKPQYWSVRIEREMLTDLGHFLSNIAPDIKFNTIKRCYDAGVFDRYVKMINDYLVATFTVGRLAELQRAKDVDGLKKLVSSIGFQRLFALCADTLAKYQHPHVEDDWNRFDDYFSGMVEAYKFYNNQPTEVAAYINKMSRADREHFYQHFTQLTLAVKDSPENEVKMVPQRRLG